MTDEQKYAADRRGSPGYLASTDFKFCRGSTPYYRLPQNGSSDADRGVDRTETSSQREVHIETMTNFIERIAQGVPYDHSRVVGYSQWEIEKIARLFDISITGQLREFLLDMGRSDGGLIGDDPIILYSPNMSVRRHILFQLRLEFSFKEYEIGAGLELLQERPFLFSVESETQYFFVTTKTDNPDRVYHYNENDETVRDIGLNFFEYMQRTVKVWGGKSAVVCNGELLVV